MLYRDALILVVISAALLVPATSDNRAFACSCAGPMPASETYENSDAVFAGKVVDIENRGLLNIVQFDVDMAWKGVSESIVLVETADSGGACGYGFERGHNYLVYARGDAKYLETGACGRTQPFETAFQDLAYLGPGYIPAPGQQIVEREPGEPWLMVLLIGVAAAGTVVVVLKRRR